MHHTYRADFRASAQIANLRLLTPAEKFDATDDVCDEECDDCDGNDTGDAGAMASDLPEAWAFSNVVVQSADGCSANASPCSQSGSFRCAPAGAAAEGGCKRG